MNITEIRDLDGPNYFLPKPAIKLEVEVPEGEELRIADSDGELIPATPEQMMERLSAIVADLHTAAGVEVPDIVSRPMEAERHYVVAYGWSHRRFAKRLAKQAVAVLTGERSDTDAIASELVEVLNSPAEEDDAPEMVPNAERTLPIIAITGTNGKTTTSRLITSVLRHAGRRVGTTSSAGVYIDGEQVIAGDYSGPSGAHRVFGEPGLDVGVLETARGGMLMRGLAFESADVGVVTNVSADHLGLHGVYSVDELAKVKGLVVKYTRHEGFVVLNADDRRVLAMREQATARPILITRRSSSPEVQQHIDSGGWALTVGDDLNITWWHDGEHEVLTSLRDVPMTFSGRAPHMVENALCGAAALLGIGLSAREVRDGLAAFRNSSRDNRGRLNVYEYNDATIVVDFAHNVAGFQMLINFGKQFLRPGGKLTAVIGTAGDRDDSVFMELGRISAEQADCVVLKDSHKYLRGREIGDMPALMRKGVEQASTGVPVDEAASEREASLMAFERAQAGDVVALMCIEDYDFLIPWLDEHGQSLS